MTFENVRETVIQVHVWAPRSLLRGGHRASGGKWDEVGEATAEKFHPQRGGMFTNAIVSWILVDSGVEQFMLLAN